MTVISSLQFTYIKCYYILYKRPRALHEEVLKMGPGDFTGPRRECGREGTKDPPEEWAEHAGEQAERAGEQAERAGDPPG